MIKDIKIEKFLQSLLTHRTVKEAAKAAGISERTAYLYLDDPTFANRYNAARDDLLRGVVNHLRGQMNAAVDVIAEVMNNAGNKPFERLTAAKYVLEFTNKYIESGDILERLGKLERDRFNDIAM
jgi:hypothetical protein